VFQGAANAARVEHDRSMRQAWMTAHLGRVKKLPKLKELLAPEPRRRKMSWQEMLGAAEAWAAA
jgi:hypothetical protein